MRTTLELRKNKRRSSAQYAVLAVPVRVRVPVCKCVRMYVVHALTLLKFGHDVKKALFRQIRQINTYRELSTGTDTIIDVRVTSLDSKSLKQ